jgi:MFS family permease
MYEAAQILLYALIAAASPSAVLATLAVLSSERGRVNGIIFMVGFVLSQSVTLVAVYLLGWFANDRARPTINAWVELAAGVAVLVLSLTRPELRKPRVRRSSSSPRTKALLERLRRVTPGVSLGIGALLGVGPKRLVLTIIAAGTLALSASSGMRTLRLGGVYVAVATIIVWLPVVYSAILGRRAEDLVARVRARTEMRGNHRASVVGLAVGTLLVAAALVRLLR